MAKQVKREGLANQVAKLRDEHLTVRDRKKTRNFWLVGSILLLASLAGTIWAASSLQNLFWFFGSIGAGCFGAMAVYAFDTKTWVTKPPIGS